MMWQEFETLAGYRVTGPDYYYFIEPMYNACPEGTTKKEFVRMISQDRFEVRTSEPTLRSAGDYLVMEYVFDDDGTREDRVLGRFEDYYYAEVFRVAYHEKHPRNTVLVIPECWLTEEKTKGTTLEN